MVAYGCLLARSLEDDVITGEIAGIDRVIADEKPWEPLPSGILVMNGKTN